MFETLPWECALGHTFAAQTGTVLEAGDWCPECVAPPWTFDEEARRNPFFAQVWYPNHDRDENHVYLKEDGHDIAGADKDEPWTGLLR